MSSMTDQELAEALEGLYAYDSGCVSSGIHDENLKARLHTVFHEKDASERVRFISQMVIDHYLSPEANKLRYGPEDALLFLRWVEGEYPEAIIFSTMDFEND